VPLGQHRGEHQLRRSARRRRWRYLRHYLPRDPVSHLIADLSVQLRYAGKELAGQLGMLGLLLLFIIYAMLFFDSIAVAREDKGLIGSMAAGWIGIMAVIGAATFYTSIHLFTMLSFLFWYFAGMVAARRTQLQTQHSMEVAAAVRSRWA